jgi:AcrR family transcriptional regulator
MALAPAQCFRNRSSFHGQLASDGLGRPPTLQERSFATGSMARWGCIHCAADIAAGHILQRPVSLRVSEHSSRNGRRVRGMDPLVLRGRLPRSAHPWIEARVTNRPRLIEGEDLPPAPLQARSLDKRTRLKAAGLARFGEKGYDGTSIEDVARSAGFAVGGFYQHFRSKRQLLLVLMDELLEGLSRIDLSPGVITDVRAGIRGVLSRAFSHDLRYLGAYRAWQEAVLSDPDLALKQEEIEAWTTARVTRFFEFLQQLPRARQRIDVAGLAQVMDGFFWTLLSQASRLSKVQLNQRVEASTHLIFHAFFVDPQPKAKTKRN